MKFPLDIRDLSIRIFVITLTSVILLLLAKNDTFDLHFKVRRTQPVTDNILIVEVPDSLPIEVAVNSLIDRKVDRILISHFLMEHFNDDRVIPFTVGDLYPNIWNLDFLIDSDGLYRRVEFVNSSSILPASIDIKKNYTINFRGPSETFPVLSFFDIVEGATPIEGKIIIIKPQNPIQTYTTPVGLLTQSEIIANTVDNILENRFIPAKTIWFPLMVLFFLLITTILFLLYFPATLAMVSTLVFALAYLSFSLWVFDTYTLWTPIAIPIVQMVLTLILISNYKFVLNEKTKWGLEKESLFFKEVEEMKTNFLSLFSHDLKTPLAKIIGIADTLQSKVTDPELSGEIEKIRISSRDLEKYIKRILKMSQVQSKNISLNKTPTDINTLIEKSVNQNRFFASEKNIKIEKKLTPMFMVDVDGDLIQEVIVNFIENALTYSPEGSMIQVSSAEVNNFVKVSVRDQGRGIPKKAQDSIWEKYYRFDSHGSGYGLGLFLSRYVINLHGGQVFLNSKENAGSEFGFLIPIEEEDS